jgi:hypothetical protein
MPKATPTPRDRWSNLLPRCGRAARIGSCRKGAGSFAAPSAFTRAKFEPVDGAEASNPFDWVARRDSNGHSLGEQSEGDIMMRSAMPSAIKAREWARKDEARK